MAVIGGDLLTAQYNNPNVGSGTFYFTASSDNSFNTGGFRNDDNKNGIDGGGRAIYVKNQQRWMVSGTISWDMSTNGTQELQKLSSLSLSNSESTWTFTHSNGSIWVGNGTIVGDFDGMGNSATIEFKCMGGGLLVQQA